MNELGEKLQVFPGIEYHLKTTELTIEVVSPKKLLDELHRADEGLKGAQNSLRSMLSRIHDILTEQAAGTDSHAQVTVTYDEIFTDVDYYYSLFESLKVCPYVFRFFSRGILNKPGFSLNYEFLQGGFECPVKVYGPIVYVYASRTFFKLKPAVFRAIWLLDRNRQPVEPSENESGDRYLLKDVLDELASSSGDILIEDYLKAFDFVIPEKVSLCVTLEGDNTVSVYPKLDGVDEGALRKRFLNTDQFGDVFILDSGERRTLVILDGSMKNIFNSIARRKKFVGDDCKKLLCNPYAIFEDGLDRSKILLDQSFFSDRVRGIVKTAFKIIGPSWKSGIDWFDDSGRSGAESASDGKAVYNIVLQSVSDGEYHEFQLDRAKLDNLEQAVQAATQQGHEIIQFDGREFQVNEVKELLDQIKSKGGEGAKREIFKVDVLSNEERVQYGKAISTKGDITIDNARIDQLEKVLKGGINLMEHQWDGIRWLLTNFNRRDSLPGCLLADEMGLGKTLQVLGFLALAFKENPEQFFNSNDDLYNPVLILANTILLRNWVNEIERSFRTDLFEPILVLHDRELKRLKISKGQEIKEGRESLDKTQIRRYKCVITNFDTLVNYQVSLCQIKWSVVVVDEAHNINSQSLRCEVVKALKASFKVFLTGTPVENNIQELWELFDSLIPGLLGSRREFMRTFGQLNRLDESPPGLLEQLRRTFSINDLNCGLILRREKSVDQPGYSVNLGLPPKEVKQQLIPINSTILESEMLICERVRRKVDSALEGLQKIQVLYTCKALAFREYEELAHLKTDSEPDLKLESLMNILDSVKKRDEKVVVFVRRFHIIDILKQAVLKRFSRVDPKVLHTREASGSNLGRKYSILDAFQKSRGFDILFLSPIMGAEGLNLQEANHVVHYERWWNPAKEKQATDRVHRIGQSRTVYVYYLLYSFGDLSAKKTFDEKLDALINNKIKLNRDFLRPSISEKELLTEFSHEYFQT